MAVRHDKRFARWSAPAFYTLGGVTLGPQIGGQAIDVVLVVVNEKGLESLTKSKCTLGGDAGIAIGPVGRAATINTDLLLTSEIFSYSRSRGLYVGLSLKGAMVAPDDRANESYYGRRLSAREIFKKIKNPYPSDGNKLQSLLEWYSSDWLRRLPSLVGALTAAGAIAVAFFFTVLRMRKT